MFPIRDHNPATRTPYITYGLIVINITVFVLMLPAAGNEAELARVYYQWGMVALWIVEGQHLSGLFTHMFLHGGLMHLAGNMLFLWIFGDNLEDELGHVGFGLFYVASGLGAAMLQILAAPYSTAPMIGASGAIAGVMGGYLLLFPRARVDVLFVFFVFFRIFPVPAWIVLALWFVIQIGNGISTAPGGAGVAYWAHAGGFAAGILGVLPIWLRRGGPDFWARNKGQPPYPAAQYRIVKSNVPRVRRRR